MNCEFCVTGGGLYSSSMASSSMAPSTMATPPACWTATAGSYFVSGFGILAQSEISSSGDMYDDGSGHAYRATPYYPETSTWLGYHEAGSEQPAQQSFSDCQLNYQNVPEQVAGDFDDCGNTAVADLSIHPEEQLHALSTPEGAAAPEAGSFPLLPFSAGTDAAANDRQSRSLNHGQDREARRPRNATATTTDATTDTTTRRGRRRHVTQPGKAEFLIFKNENQKTLDSLPGSSGQHTEDDVGCVGSGIGSSSGNKAGRRNRDRHNSVERKYRLGLNKKLVQLRAALPAQKLRSASEADANFHDGYDAMYSPRFSKVRASCQRAVNISV